MPQQKNRGVDQCWPSKMEIPTYTNQQLGILLNNVRVGRVGCWLTPYDDHPFGVERFGALEHWVERCMVHRGKLIAAGAKGWVAESSCECPQETLTAANDKSKTWHVPMSFTTLLFSEQASQTCQAARLFVHGYDFLREKVWHLFWHNTCFSHNMLYASLQSSYKDRCKHPALSNMAFACFGRSSNATKNSPLMNPAHLLRRAFPGKGIWADPIFVQLVVIILSMESPFIEASLFFGLILIVFLEWEALKVFRSTSITLSLFDVFSRPWTHLSYHRGPPRMELTELLKGGWLCSLPSHTHSLRSYPWTSPAPPSDMIKGNRYSAVLYHYIKLYNYAI